MRPLLSPGWLAFVAYASLALHGCRGARSSQRCPSAPAAPTAPTAPAAPIVRAPVTSRPRPDCNALTARTGMPAGGVAAAAIPEAEVRRALTAFLPPGHPHTGVSGASPEERAAYRT